MNEARLQLKIRKALIKQFGGKWVKWHGNRWGSAGMPDLVGCVGGQFYGIEVKMPGKHLTELQAATLEEYEEVGAVVGVATNLEEAISIVQNHIDSRVLEAIK